MKQNMIPKHEAYQSGRDVVRQHLGQLRDLACRFDNEEDAFDEMATAWINGIKNQLIQTFGIGKANTKLNLFTSGKTRNT